jgi:hypothetical protein
MADPKSETRDEMVTRTSREMTDGGKAARDAQARSDAATRKSIDFCDQAARETIAQNPANEWARAENPAVKDGPKG